jgi:hypothetical protein
MDSDSERGQLLRHFDCLSGGGHIGHDCGAGQHTLGMSLSYGLVHALAETEVVCIHYDAFFHPGKFMQGAEQGQSDYSG